MTSLSTVAVAALTALALWPPLTRDSAALLWLDVTVAILSIAAVPVLLRRPLPAGLAVSALAALSPVATPAATVAALYTARWRRLPTAAIVAAVGLAGHAAQGLWRPNPGLPYGWWLLLTAVAYAGLVGWGALAQARAALLASLRERARRAEREQERRVAEARLAERTRIAREMHDVLAHRLSLLAVYAGALRVSPGAPPQERAAAEVIRQGAYAALEELRQVIWVARDPSAAELDGPQPTLADLPVLLEESHRAGTEVTLSVEGSLNEVPDGIGRHVYRVVQEGLTNARKHAPGQTVHLRLSISGGAEVELCNDLVASSSIPGAGAGLAGLRERVTLLGGILSFGCTPNRRFRLHAWIPFPS